MIRLYWSFNYKIGRNENDFEIDMGFEKIKGVFLIDFIKFYLK